MNALEDDSLHPEAAASARDTRRTLRPDTLDRFTERLSTCEGVNLLGLEPLTTLVVTTSHSVYRMVVLHDNTILVHGGRSFSDAAIGQLQGSGFGGNLLKVGWIGVGLRMEIWSQGKRFVTSTVRAIMAESNFSMHGPQ